MTELGPLVDERCGTCRFWLRHAEGEELPDSGNCRRLPPVTYFGCSQYGFAVSKEDEWCGEWSGSN